MLLLLYKIQQRLAHVWHAWVGFPVVSFGADTAERRALLVYLSSGVTWATDDPRLCGHQNIRQSRTLAELLVQRGYQVDVVHYDDRRFRVARKFDLVIAHPGVVSAQIQAMPPSIGTRLSLRTGRHASFVDEAVEARYASLRQRRACTLAWPGMGETDAVYQGFDAIACFDGDGTARSTFAGVGIPVYPFRNHANPAISYVNKDFTQARQGYLYMASQLPILKGLDWLLEQFAKTPDKHLYLCGTIHREIKALYARELALANIHVLGHMHPQSVAFRQLLQKATWYISPSASEGCQGTALDMMAAGLIPIVSDVCGVDVGLSGVRLSPCSPETLAEAIHQTDRFSLEDLEIMSHQARACVEQRYSEIHFRQDWNRILDQVGGLP